MVSGTVTDGNGAPIVGARVAIGSQSTTTTQAGVYTIPQVEVPAGQASIVATVTASSTVNGKLWTGQNMVEVLTNEANTPNVHIVISDSTKQGSISGTVRDGQTGQPLQGARVFAADGPYTDQQGGQFFTVFSSYNAYTDSHGNYTLPNLPTSSNGTTLNYTVTASLAARINQTVSSIVVSPGVSTTVNFTLNTASGSSTVPKVANFQASAFTLPSIPTRAAGTSASEGAINALKHFILEKRGWLTHHAASAQQVVLRRSVSRNTPAGSLIESILIWDYQPLNNLFGYDVARSIGDLTHFASIATIRDPLADRFSDLDPVLTPGQNTYYSVARLDTINFPANGAEGDPSDVRVVQPLSPISLTGPASGATLSTTPTFSWTRVPRPSLVSGANLYQILVYDTFPNYQSDTDPNGVRPIWPADPNNPGASLVTDPGTDLTQHPTLSQTYQGPALTHGHTYYWAVLAQDSVGSAFSISPIQSFVAP